MTRFLFIKSDTEVLSVAAENLFSLEYESAGKVALRFKTVRSGLEGTSKVVLNVTSGREQEVILDIDKQIKLPNKSFIYTDIAVSSNEKNRAGGFISRSPQKSTLDVLSIDSITHTAASIVYNAYAVSCVDGDNSDEEKIRLTGSDGSADDVVLEAGTGLSIARSGDKITFTNTVTDTDTVLTSEQVQDIVGAMFSGNTETRISATYQDGDGNIDLVVDAIPVDLTSDGAGTIHANNVPTLNQSTTGNADTATALATARAINGVNFDGTAPITITAAGSTLSDTVTVAKGGTGATTLTSNALLTGNGTSAIQAEADLTFDGGDLSVSSSVSNKPSLLLNNTNTNGLAPQLVFKKSTTGADGDDLGKIFFNGLDAADNDQTFGFILCEIDEADDGSEEGKMTIKVASHDGELQPGLIVTSGAAEDVVNVTLGNDSACVVTTAGTFTSAAVNTGVYKMGGHVINDVDLAGEFVDSDEHLMTSAAIDDRIAAVAGADGWHGSTSRIKILPRDFIPSDGGRPAMIDDTGVGLEQLFVESFSSNVLYVSIPIPTGFKATHVKINGSATDAVECWEFQIDSKTGVSKGTGNVGTEINITDVTSSATNYLLLQVANASGNEIHGGYVTIAAV